MDFDGMQAGCLLSFLFPHLFLRVGQHHEGSLSWKLLEHESETMALAQKVLVLHFSSNVTMGRLLGL